MKLSDAAFAAQITLVDDEIMTWFDVDEDEEDPGATLVRLAETDTADGCVFADVDVDLTNQNWVELVPIDGTESRTIEFYMLRPMTVQDFSG